MPVFQVIFETFSALAKRIFSSSPSTGSFNGNILSARASAYIASKILRLRKKSGCSFFYIILFEFLNKLCVFYHFCLLHCNFKVFLNFLVLNSKQLYIIISSFSLRTGTSFFTVFQTILISLSGPKSLLRTEPKRESFFIQNVESAWQLNVMP